MMIRFHSKTDSMIDFGVPTARNGLLCLTFSNHPPSTLGVVRVNGRVLYYYHHPRQRSEQRDSILIDANEVEII